ncbi:MAG TPA: DUF167 family protein [Dongiaceae bacterium]|nr:DUF167 family protein [Dongiaceae bacterium]
MPSPFATAAEGIRVRVRVSPRAGRDRIDGLAVDPDGGAALKVAVTAAPEGGKANAALVRLLAREWDVAKSAITVAGGAAGRRKTLHVAGEPRALLRALDDWLSRQTGGGTG